ncbi:hypothetical protein FHG87_016308 [Trinorchestia longiramus]|nr:hypothetical protein FHG87_016308 [Trinorchestia longiramus]
MLDFNYSCLFRADEDNLENFRHSPALDKNVLVHGGAGDDAGTGDAAGADTSDGAGGAASDTGAVSTGGRSVRPKQNIRVDPTKDLQAAAGAEGSGSHGTLAEALQQLRAVQGSINSLHESLTAGRNNQLQQQHVAQQQVVQQQHHNQQVAQQHQQVAQQHQQVAQQHQQQVAQQQVVQQHQQQVAQQHQQQVAQQQLAQQHQQQLVQQRKEQQSSLQPLLQPQQQHPLLQLQLLQHQLPSHSITATPQLPLNDRAVDLALSSTLPSGLDSSTAAASALQQCFSQLHLHSLEIQALNKQLQVRHQQQMLQIYQQQLQQQQLQQMYRSAYNPYIDPLMMPMNYFHQVPSYALPPSPAFSFPSASLALPSPSTFPSASMTLPSASMTLPSASTTLPSASITFPSALPAAASTSLPVVDASGFAVYSGLISPPSTSTAIVSNSELPNVNTLQPPPY